MTPAPNATTSLYPTQHQVKGWLQRQLKKGWLKVFLAGLWLSFIAAHVATDSLPSQLLDRRLQTLFFEIRGPMAAPEDIVILAVDDESLSQAEYYQTAPEQYPELAPIATVPLQRRAYAIAIERLMQAGAKAVAVDVLFFTDSGYGPEDDAALGAVLERYGDRIVLAAIYDDANLRQGVLIRPLQPITTFLNTPVQTGTINFPMEADGRIHRHGRAYLEDVRLNLADIEETSTLDSELTQIHSFAEAILSAAQIEPPTPRGQFINFHGPNRSFTHIPFWYILDADPWANQLDSGRFFQDKIVLVGGTAKIFQDFHRAPFSGTLLHRSPMAGVEILANDTANLRQGNALKQFMEFSWLRAILVFSIGAGFGVLLWHFNRPIARLGWTAAIASLWFWLSYLAFSMGGYLLPTGAPIVGFIVIGGAFIVADIVTEQFRKQRLRQTLEQYVTSPIVQEIISQQDDLQDLLKLREAEVIGLLLGNRYRIVRLLGSGGFGETYVAEDTQRPGSPICVVKQLRIMSNDPKSHRLGRRFFLGEAETLEKLGHHDQIPRLLAYFEAHHSFYLVEEMIEGRVLKDELAGRRPMPQTYVLELLKGLLPVIAFVHSQGVIHRDIKPSNIIRRKSDGRLVLIDFGAVKLISNRLADTEANLTSTVGVGTQGYMPSEQAAGLPKFGSDLYALGITALEALTGVPAYALKRDANGEVLWRYEVPGINPSFAGVLTRLVLYDFTERYQSAWEVLKDLETVEASLKSQLEAMVPGSASTTFTPDDNVADEDVEESTDATRLLPHNWSSGIEISSESEFPTIQ
jgi:CHASE2 domain-containing sensor protein